MKKALQQKFMTAGRITAYVVFALLIFVVGFRISFPVSVLIDRIQQQAARAGIHLEIGDAELSGLLGITLKDVEIGPVNGDFRMKVTEMDASAGLFSLLTGNPHLTLTAKSGIGTIGPVDIIKSGKNIFVTIDKIDKFPLRKIPVKIGKLSAVITSGKGNFRYDLAGGLYQSRGSLEIKLEHTGLLKPSVKIPGFGDFKLTSIDLGQLNVLVEVGRRTEIKTLRKYRGMRSTERVVNMGRLVVNGRDLKLLVSPSSTITIPRHGSIMNGQLNLEVAFHIMNSFFDKKTKINGKLDQPNKGLRTLLSLDAKWKRAWYKGFYGLICTGAMRRPHCFPKRTNQKISYFHLNKKETVKPKAGSLFGGFKKAPPSEPPKQPPVSSFKKKRPFRPSHKVYSGFVPSRRKAWKTARPAVHPSQAVENAALKNIGHRLPMSPVRNTIHIDMAKPMLKAMKALPKQDDDEESGP